MMVVVVIRGTYIGAGSAVKERETTSYYYLLPTADTATRGGSLVRTAGTIIGRLL